ncbi:hypothetical protein Avbf_12687 [Armadillidium vulgare]|nr:hypothetical protein Avbf_12687 [Armadillidium vulgare]
MFNKQSISPSCWKKKKFRYRKTLSCY